MWEVIIVYTFGFLLLAGCAFLMLIAAISGTVSPPISTWGIVTSAIAPLTWMIIGVLALQALVFMTLTRVRNTEIIPHFARHDLKSRQQVQSCQSIFLPPDRQEHSGEYLGQTPKISQENER